MGSEQLSPESIYDLVAYVGFRKYFHLGGLEATKELIELLNIDKNKYVLEVGCASGKTACYMAKTYDCQVVGVDISEKMVSRANERAIRERMVDKVRFHVADAQNLPFEDECFDMVMGEFITGLFEDKRRAINEYSRVVKPRGNVGFNEVTWIKAPPEGLTEYLSRTFGVKGGILDSDGWKELFSNAGLKDTVVRTHQVGSLSNKWDDLTDFLRVAHRAFYLYLKSPAFRRFIKEVFTVPRNLVDYFGYGIYVWGK